VYIRKKYVELCADDILITIEYLLVCHF